jgi:DNA-binding SARP family transcriptional activator
VVTDDWTASQSTEGQPFLHTATELLRAGQYEHLAELFEQMQLAHDRRGDIIPAQVLALACRICLACSQSQAEANWHRQAREEATRREDELRRQLSTLLELIGERDVSVVPGEWNKIPEPPTALLGPPKPRLPEREESLTLWQRFLNVLHLRLGPQPPEAAVSGVPVQRPAPAATDREDVERRPPVEGVETMAQPPEEDAHELLSAAREQEVPVLPPDLPERKAILVPPAGPQGEKEPSPPSLVVYCLGPFRVYQDDQLIADWESLKAKSILKYLVTHHGKPIAKDVLMDLFWPEAEPEAARRNLHQAVYSLRKILRQRRPDFPYVWFEDDCYLLNPQTSAWLDFEQFEQCYRDGQRMEAAGRLAEAIEQYGIAEGLYQGDFLEEELYEDWPTLQRRHIRTLYLQMADHLSEYYIRHGDLAAAIVLCRKILSVDSCYEEAHRKLMRCYLAQGQRHLAVRQYQACMQALGEELDLTPSEETAELYQRITAGG